MYICVAFVVFVFVVQLFHQLTFRGGGVGWGFGFDRALSAARFVLDYCLFGRFNSLFCSASVLSTSFLSWSKFAAFFCAALTPVRVMMIMAGVSLIFPARRQDVSAIILVVLAPAFL